MLLLYASCILQCVFDKNVIATEQMPPRLLEMSLQQINKLLTNIGDKVQRERQILSQIESDKENQGTRQNQKHSEPFDKAAARKLIDLWKLTRAGSVVPELQDDPLHDSEFTIPTPTTKRENILDKTYSKRTMLDFMKNQNVSYCLAALHRLFLFLYEKTNEEVDVFFILHFAFTTAIWRLADNRKHECLGPLLRDRILRATIWTKLVEPLQMRGKDQTVEICESFINKFLAPFNRLCGTLFLKTLIKDINLIYSSINPTGERSVRKR